MEVLGTKLGTSLLVVTHTLNTVRQFNEMISTYIMRTQSY